MSDAPQDPTRIDIDVDPTAQRLSGIAAHGMMDFDVPYVSQLEGNLWQGGCENGLILPTFFKHVVSLYPWEAYTVTHTLDSFVKVRMYDHESQGFDQVDALAAWVNVCRRSGPILVHCQAGLNRSSLIAGRALILDGMAPADAVALIRDKRSPACLCNPAFEQWLLHGTDE